MHRLCAQTSHGVCSLSLDRFVNLPHMKKFLAFLMLIGLVGSAAAELPFIQDNYQQALAKAKRQKQPIFVECWAPW